MGDTDALHVGRTNRPQALRDRSLEAEGLVDNGDVVVDGFGHPDHADLQLPLTNCFIQEKNPPVSPISSDHIQLVNVVFD